MKTSISIKTATMITDFSRRTLWRRVKDGLLARAAADERGRTMVELETLRDMLVLPITPEDLELLARADRGDGEAQCEIGLMFLEFEKPEPAVHWFTLAAKQGHADAMHYLGRLYLSDGGGGKDQELGRYWLTQAAEHGHVIAREQLALIPAD